MVKSWRPIPFDGNRRSVLPSRWESKHFRSKHFHFRWLRFRGIMLHPAKNESASNRTECLRRATFRSIRISQVLLRRDDNLTQGLPFDSTCAGEPGRGSNGEIRGTRRKARKNGQRIGDPLAVDSRLAFLSQGSRPQPPRYSLSPFWRSGVSEYTPCWRTSTRRGYVPNFAMSLAVIRLERIPSSRLSQLMTAGA